MVEWKQMWEVTTWDKNFSGVEKYMQPKVIKYYYYLANELVNLERPDGDVRILYTTNKEAYAISNEVEGNISEGEVVTIPWGGNVNIQYYKGKFVTADNRIATSNNIDYLSNKFLYYWMLSQKEEIAKMYRGAGIQHPSMLSVLSMSIPIPSLEEQTRIVGILDTFTSAIDNLKEQIAQRRKQYEYYRDQLLDLEGKPGVEMKQVDDLCEVRGRIGFRGYTRKDQVEKGDGALVLTATNISNQRIDYSNNTYITWEKYYESPEIMVKNGDILVCQRGSIGKIAIVDNLTEKATINPQLLLIKTIKIDNKYLTYYFLSCYFQSKLSQIIGYGTIQMISQKDFKNLTIPLPPLQEQQRIVSILDTFEASIANLEAQLAQREKQYEYYRNKLLTFE